MKKILTLLITLICINVNVCFSYEIKDSVVVIKQNNSPVCSGVVISNSGNSSMVVTAKHCVNKPITIPDVTVNSILIYENADLALIQSTGFLTKTPVKFDENYSYKIGEPVFLVGYPRGNLFYTEGKILKDRTSFYNLSNNIIGVNGGYYKCDGIVIPGTSGGGVFSNGKFVGTVVAVNSKGTTFVPLTILIEFITYAGKL